MKHCHNNLVILTFESSKSKRVKPSISLEKKKIPCSSKSLIVLVTKKLIAVFVLGLSV